MNTFRTFQVVSVHTNVHTTHVATVFKNNNSPYWKARFTNAAGTRVSRSTKSTSKREAKKIAERFEANEMADQNDSLTLSTAFGKILQRVIREAEAGKLGLAKAESYVREIHKIANPDFEETSRTLPQSRSRRRSKRPIRAVEKELPLTKLWRVFGE